MSIAPPFANCRLTSTESPCDSGWVSDIKATVSRAVPGDCAVAAGIVVEPTGSVLFDRSVDPPGEPLGAGAPLAATEASAAVLERRVRELRGADA